MEIIKKILNWLKDLLILICFFGQLILIYLIATKVFKDMDLGLLILYYIASEFIINLFNECSLTRLIISAFNKKDKK